MNAGPGLRFWALLTALFLAAGVALYANALDNPFHFDDHHGIVDNHHLRDPGKIPDFFHYWRSKHFFAPTEPQATHYRPLVLTTYALNFLVGGESPVSFHLYHVLLHVVGSLLLVALGARLGLSLPWAIGVGTAFLLHPLHTEAINYITARSSLQSGTLSLAALLAFVCARQGTGNRRLGWLMFAFILAGAALLTKEVAVVIPALFLLYDLLYPPPRAERWGVHGYGLGLGLGVMGVLFLTLAGHLDYFLKVLKGQAGPRGMGENLWLQTQVLTEWVRLVVWPRGLSIVHDFAQPGFGAPAVMGTLFLGAVTLAALFFWRRLPLLAMGWGIFLIVLLPTTLLPMNTPLQESRGYAALAGVFLALGAVLAPAFRTLSPAPAWRWAALVVLIPLALGTLNRNPVWGSDMALWTDAVAKAPLDFRAHSNLAAAFQAQGDFPTAVGHYRRAIEIYPKEAALFSDLGGALTEIGDMDGAREALDTAVELFPEYAPTHYNLGVFRERTGDLDGARSAYERSIEIVPTYTKARVNLGILKARAGDLHGAAEQMEQALAVAPREAAIYANLMLVYRHLGARDAAVALYQRAEKEGTVTPRLDLIFKQIAP